MVFTFQCPNCDCKSEYESLVMGDIKSSGVILCPSCRSLYDVHNDDLDRSYLAVASDEPRKILATKSKFDNPSTLVNHLYDKIDAVRKQSVATSRATYPLPCPHCNHEWKMEGIPANSVHWCAKCYQYFGVDDITVKFMKADKRPSFKSRYRVSKIYRDSVFTDMDKLAEWWTKECAASKLEDNSVPAEQESTTGTAEQQNLS